MSVIKIKEVRYSDGLRNLLVVSKDECEFPRVAAIYVDASGRAFFKEAAGR